ncbi:MAG: aspartate--tRNA ligase [Spirochaetales bacterium]|nr:aspartate--tRNA ligase [Spirochaetales bacterium]
MKLKRTHNCGELRSENIGETVTLNGWVGSCRDHGGVTFIDLYDRWGLTQIVFDPEYSQETHKIAHTLRGQYVVAVKGDVKPRPEGMANPNIETGEVDVYVSEFELLNSSKTPPFDILHAGSVHAETKLKYRYLDLRSPEMQQRLIFRARATHMIRNFFMDNEFVEIETPILGRATPEGARDYLVPSRVNQGKFYALPQSPQLYKQSLMVSGFDRYFQIARCFRDEDLRAERQPEFTQVDLEMSFVSSDDVITLLEKLFVKLMKEMKDIDIKIPMTSITYQDAMLKYGSDAPDLRFGFEITDITDVFQNTGFGVFKNAVKNGGCIRAINLKGYSKQLSRKDLDELTPFVKPMRGKGVAWIRMNEEGPQSPIIKFFSEAEAENLYKMMDAEAGDVIILLADTEKIVSQCLAAIRGRFAKKFDLIKENDFAFTWVVDFPLFEADDDGNPTPTHHPFTSPKPEDMHLLDGSKEDLLKIKSDAYDIVLNGSEIGGGSIRIHDHKVQEKIFRILGIDEEEAKEKFGFLLDALQYGAPPHGGVALGLDRVIMILLGTDAIRDVIAFPKTQKATCLMTDAPGTVDEEQLDELALEISLFDDEEDKDDD